MISDGSGGLGLFLGFVAGVVGPGCFCLFLFGTCPKIPLI